MSKEILQAAITKWGVVPQIEMLNEEANELALAARKWLRKGTEKEFENLAEEIADVEILIDQMEIIYPNIRERILQYRAQKMERLERRVNGNDFEGK